MVQYVPFGPCTGPNPVQCEYINRVRDFKCFRQMCLGLVQKNISWFLFSVVVLTIIFFKYRLLLICGNFRFGLQVQCTEPYVQASFNLFQIFLTIVFGWAKVVISVYCEQNPLQCDLISLNYLTKHNMWSSWNATSIFLDSKQTSYETNEILQQLRIIVVRDQQKTRCWSRSNIIV